MADWQKLYSWKTERRINKNEQNLKDIWDTVKHTGIYINTLPEREDRTKGEKINIWRNNSWKFPKSGEGLIHRLGGTENPQENQQKHIHTEPSYT